MWYIFVPTNNSISLSLFSFLFFFNVEEMLMHDADPTKLVVLDFNLISVVIIYKCSIF